MVRRLPALSLRSTATMGDIPPRLPCSTSTSPAHVPSACSVKSVNFRAWLVES